MPLSLPPGSKVTNLTDIAGRISRAWDVLTGRSFNPGKPLQPIANDEEQLGGPRQFQYPVTSNMQTRPRAEYPDLTPYEQLRNLARLYDVAALCVNTRVEEMCGVDWAIVAKNKKRQKEFEDAGIIDQVTRFWEYPDRLNDFSAWLASGLRDTFEIDALTLYPRRDRSNTGPGGKGRLYALEVVDGSTVKPVLDDRGRALAYQQVLYGMPMSQYNRWGADAPDEFLPLTVQLQNGQTLPVTQELIYKPRNVRADSPYGFSPTEWVLLRVNMALRKQNFDLSWFTEGNIPEMIASPPVDKLNVEQVAQFERKFNDMLTGNDAARSKLRFFPWPANTQILKSFNYDTKLDLWMLQITCAAYAVTPSEIGFTGDVNRATADSQENITYRKGLKPLAKWLKQLFDRIIAIELGFPDLEWVWKFNEAEDNLTKAQELQIYIQNGVLTPGEVRAMQFSGEVEGDAPTTLPASGASDTDSAPPTDDSSTSATDSSNTDDQTSVDVTDSTDQSAIDTDLPSNVTDLSGDETQKLMTTIFEKARKKGPGSRGGKFWLDKNGIAHYGAPPKGTRAHSSQEQLNQHIRNLAKQQLTGVKTVADLNNLDGSWEVGVDGPNSNEEGGYNHFGSGKDGHDAAIEAATQAAKEHPDITYAIIKVDGNYVLAGKSTSDLQKDAAQEDNEPASQRAANTAARRKKARGDKPDNVV